MGRMKEQEEVGERRVKDHLCYKNVSLEFSRNRLGWEMTRRKQQKRTVMTKKKTNKRV